jgi:hypothetical protein
MGNPEFMHVAHEYLTGGFPGVFCPLMKISLEPVSTLRSYLNPATVMGRVKK